MLLNIILFIYLNAIKYYFIYLFIYLNAIEYYFIYLFIYLFERY